MRLTNHDDFAAQLHPLYFSEYCATVSYLPEARVPYYRFIGRKRLSSSAVLMAIIA
jgi:hypothetical protein